MKKTEIVKEDNRLSFSKVTYRKAELSDFDDLVELLVKFYTQYEHLSAHVGIQDEDVRELVKSRLRTTFASGFCVVACIHGKIEGLFVGMMFHRYDPYVPDYKHLPERVYAIEGLCDVLTANLWDQVPPKFNTVCQLTYGLVTTNAQGYSIGKHLMKMAMQLCLEKKVYVLMIESLSDKTARWVRNEGFVVAKTYPLDQWKDKNGRPYFEGQPDKEAVLLLSFLDNTIEYILNKSKL